MDIDKSSDLILLTKFIVNNFYKIILLIIVGVILGYFLSSYSMESKNYTATYDARTINNSDTQEINYLLKQVYSFQNQTEKLFTLDSDSYDLLSYIYFRDYIKHNYKDYKVLPQPNNSNSISIFFLDKDNLNENDIKNKLIKIKDSANEYFITSLNKQFEKIVQSFNSIRDFKIAQLLNEKKILEEKQKSLLQQLIIRFEEEKKIAIELGITESLIVGNNIQMTISLDEGNDIESIDDKQFLFLYGSTILQKKIDIIKSRLNSEMYSSELRENSFDINEIQSLTYDTQIINVLDKYADDKLFFNNYTFKSSNYQSAIGFFQRYLIFLISITPLFLYLIFNYLYFFFIKLKKEL